MSHRFLDDIARAMTDIEAPSDLCGRVLAGIARPRHRRWSAAIVPMAAAASVVAVAVIGSRPFLTELDVPVVPRPSLVQPAETLPAAPALVTTAAAAAALRPAIALSSDELAWMSRRLPALETPVLALAPIQPTVASIAPISVELIALEPISVPPPGAGPGDRR
jgi:hypothetical protein